MENISEVMSEIHDMLINRGFAVLLQIDDIGFKGFDVWNPKTEELVLSLHQRNPFENIVVCNYALDNLTKLNVIDFKPTKTNKPKLIAEINRQLIDRETNTVNKRKMQEHQAFRKTLK